MDKKVAIFDFDGTLADVIVVLRSLYGDVAVKRGWPDLTDEALQLLRKGTYREALKWLGVRPWQMPALMREGRRLYYARRSEVRLFEGMAEVLAELHHRGWDMYVLSINSEQTIKDLLADYRVDHLVHVLRRPAVFGKAMSINRLVRRRGYSRQNVWMIGDELRDVDAAKKAQVKSVAVAWGLQDRELLKNASPTGLADTPADIVRLLTSKET